jgi:hypothetical protein
MALLVICRPVYLFASLELLAQSRGNYVGNPVRRGSSGGSQLVVGCMRQNCWLKTYSYEWMLPCLRDGTADIKGMGTALSRLVTFLYLNLSPVVQPLLRTICLDVSSAHGKNW